MAHTPGRAPAKICSHMRRLLLASVVLACAALRLVPIVHTQNATPTAPDGLRIVVLEGEDGVNVVQQRTAVSPVVEVRDRNNLPVAGAIVRFAVRSGRANFASGRTLVVTTDAAGRATATGLTPTGTGAGTITATASFQGQAATAVIAQVNVATAAQVAGAAAGAGAAGAGGGAAAAGGATAAGAGAGTGAGISATTIGVIGGAAAGGALAAAKVIGHGSDSDGPGYS